MDKRKLVPTYYVTTHLDHPPSY